MTNQSDLRLWGLSTQQMLEPVLSPEGRARLRAAIVANRESPNPEIFGMTLAEILVEQHALALAAGKIAIQQLTVLVAADAAP